MNSEIGSVLIILALCLALIQAIFPLLVARSNGAHYVSLARSAAYGQAFFIAAAFGLLVYCFVIGDYSVLYVATNSNPDLPTRFKVSATWGGHEGSLLLWVLCLNLWTIAVCIFSKQLPTRYTARIIGVMGLVSIGFILFILVTSNPFTPQYYDYFNVTPDFVEKFTLAVKNSTDPAFKTMLDKFGFTPEKVAQLKSPNSSLLMLQFPGGKSSALQAMLTQYNLGSDFKVSHLYSSVQRGGDLNPLLQDFGLIVHPPLLYMGYVGFSVAFSFAIAALLGGKLDSSWARWSRPWTTMAWVFLTCGITLGSWWAYYELGWGGWWFWDPVENASFMPWLVGTALIHSLAVTEKRGAFQTWTVFLAIIAFSLSLLGTFLVRSGILNSVHSFASDPARGLFILTYLIIVIGGSLLLYARQGPNIKSTGTFKEFSREGAMMLNNIILMVVAATVLIGTLYPVFLSAIMHKDISVGPSWFNWFFVKMMMPLAFLAGLGPLMRWKKQNPKVLIKQITPYIIISILTGLVYWNFIAAKDDTEWLVAVAISLSTWVILATGEVIFYRRRKMGSFKRATSSLTFGSIGMMLAHFGIAVFMIGATFAGTKTVKADIKISPGESYTQENYRFKLVSVRWHQGVNYNAYEGQFYVYRDNVLLTVLKSQKRYYHSQGKSSRMTEAGIDPGPTRDLFVSMGNPVNSFIHRYLSSFPKNINGKRVLINESQKKIINETLQRTAWVVRIQHKPYVRWIWIGAVFMAFGGLLAALDKRYRTRRGKKTSSGNPVTPKEIGNNPAALSQDTGSGMKS
ncbi:Cytochrome c heme lyase subunit CcmF [hydrothermal vent metagenome]|uniref:Cytochrome c heme lyase subunit CcmF n=1 Tax=hydrothermal vent metagenome TaxID=652676 RepID=A0A3B0YYE1_9ZZZZ